MKIKFSRRDLLAKGAVAMGAAFICEVAGGIGCMPVVEALAKEATKEETMPHISIKLFPGRSEAVKQRLADAIVKDVVDIIGSDESSVTVTIEEVSSGAWKERVYEPEVQAKKDHLYKKPGYSM